MRDLPGPDVGGAVPAVLVVAQRARLLAAAVRERAAVVRSPTDGWRGPAADVARGVSDDVADRMARCAAALDDVAGAALAHARTVDDRVEELESLARRARDLLLDLADPR